MGGGERIGARASGMTLNINAATHSYRLAGMCVFIVVIVVRA